MWFFARIPKARGGGSRSIESAKRAFQPFIERPPNWPLASMTELPPEPFFCGAGLDRADALRADDGALRSLAADAAARELKWRDGLPELTADGRLVWGTPSTPQLFLGFDGKAPRFCAIEDVTADARTAFPLMAQLHPDDAPLFAAALSLARWHSRHRFCANCGHLGEP